MGQMFQPGGAGYFVPTMPQAQRGFFNPAQMAQVRPSPRWQTPQQATRPTVQTAAAAGMLMHRAHIYILSPNARKEKI